MGIGTFITFVLTLEAHWIKGLYLHPGWATGYLTVLMKGGSLLYPLPTNPLLKPGRKESGRGYSTILILGITY